MVKNARDFQVIFVVTPTPYGFFKFPWIVSRSLVVKSVHSPIHIHIKTPLQNNIVNKFP